MSTPMGYQNTITETQYEQSQYTMPPIPGMAPDASRAYYNVTPTPDVTTQNDAYLRLGIYTPDTDVGNIPADPRPDISLYCKYCTKHIGLRYLQEHRMYHRALDTMSYHGGSYPESVAALRERRMALLAKLRSRARIDGTVDPSKIQKLNEAYELLKADLEDTFDAYRRILEDVDTDVRGLALNCSTACAPAVAICSHGNERWKSSMEDTRVFQDYFGNDPDKCFFGLYDGHNGRFAAELAANELHHLLLIEMEKFDPRTKCTCTFNMADSYDLSSYDMKEIHSRPPSNYTERGTIHEKSANIIQQIIRTCEERLSSMEEPETKSDDRPAENQDSDKQKTSKKRLKNPFAEKMSHAFKKAHKSTDFLLSYGKDELSRVRWSGCSTLACVIQNTPERPDNNDLKEDNEGQEQEKMSADLPNDDDEDKSMVEPPKQLGIIHMANAGNVHGVLVRANRAYRLTRDHTPSNPKEKCRILRAGGSVNEGGRDLRVNGVLATTRGLGNHGDLNLKRCVITEPHTASVEIDQYAQFLILATNGVWEVFTEHEAASILLEMLPSNHVPPPSSVSTSLNFIYDAGRSRSDGENESQYTPISSHISEGQQSRNGLTPSKERVFGNLASKTAVIPSDEPKSAFEQHNITRTRRTPSGAASEVKSSADGDDSQADDMRPQIGSRIHSEAGESGNEADVETDFVTLSARSRTSGGRQMGSGLEKQKERDFAKTLAERLVQAALLAGSKDNITVMVVLLAGWASC